MGNPEEMDLAEQVMRLAARVAELEERLARLENNPPARLAYMGGEVDAVNTVANEVMVGGIRTVLEKLGEAEAGQIRQELVKNGFPASLTRSDINKVLYHHTGLFSKAAGDEGKPKWRLI